MVEVSDKGLGKAFVLHWFNLWLLMTMMDLIVADNDDTYDLIMDDVLIVMIRDDRDW